MMYILNLGGIMLKRTNIYIIYCLITIFSVTAGCGISNNGEIIGYGVSTENTSEGENTGDTLSDTEIEKSINSEIPMDTNQQQSNEQLLSVISSDIRNQKQWGFINELIDILGKTAIDIVTETGWQVAYEWLEEGSDLLALHDGGIAINCLFFSSSIWGNDSYCTGIFLESYVYHKLPERVEEMESLFGKAVKWEEKGIDKNAFYQYLFDDNIEIRFYSNSDGTALTENVLIKTADTENLNGNTGYEDLYDNREYLSPQKRNTDNWEEINKYISCIGKSLEEIIIDYPAIEYIPDYHHYEDMISGVIFVIWGDRCDFVYVPVVLVIDTNEKIISREQMNNCWGIDYVWFSEESCAYSYRFEDVTVYFDSELDGSVSVDSYIKIG